MRKLRPRRRTHGALYLESHAPIGIGNIAADDYILRRLPVGHGRGKFKFGAPNDCSRGPRRPLGLILGTNLGGTAAGDASATSDAGVVVDSSVITLIVDPAPPLRPVVGP